MTVTFKWQGEDEEKEAFAIFCVKGLQYKLRVPNKSFAEKISQLLENVYEDGRGTGICEAEASIKSSIDGLLRRKTSKQKEAESEIEQRRR